MVISSRAMRPTRLAVFEHFIFWTNSKRGTIERASKVDGTNQTTILDNQGGVVDILVAHASKQVGKFVCCPSAIFNGIWRLLTPRD